MAVEDQIKQLEDLGYKIIPPGSKEVPFDPAHLEWMLSRLEQYQNRYMEAEGFIMDECLKSFTFKLSKKAIAFVSAQIEKYQ